MPELPIPPNGIVVGPGDTVYSISLRYGVPVRAIIDENDLRPPFRLRVDRRLTMPQPRHHVVEAGDTRRWPLRGGLARGGVLLEAV